MNRLQNFLIATKRWSGIWAKKQAGLATGLRQKEGQKTISNQTARSFRRERTAPMPNGSNIKAPAMTVDASGTGAAGTATGSPPGLEEFQETDPSLPLAMPKAGP